MRKSAGRVGRLLRQATRCGNTKTEGMARKVLELEASLWTFVHMDGVEPTNNSAELRVRHGVMWRKTSYGTQSARGSRFVKRMLTVIATLRQQRRNVLEYQTAACRASLRGEHPPTLLPPSRLAKAAGGRERIRMPYVISSDCVAGVVAPRGLMPRRFEKRDDCFAHGAGQCSC